jgi:hypothetical protein
MCLPLRVLLRRRLPVLLQMQMQMQMQMRLHRS